MEAAEGWLIRSEQILEEILNLHLVGVLKEESSVVMYAEKDCTCKKQGHGHVLKECFARAWCYEYVCP